ncbi:N/A [soil metagenome]
MRFFIVCTILIICSLAIGCTGWAFRVPTDNMLPTIKIGDTCVINRFEYSSKPIERFEIVAFNAPEWAKKQVNLKENITFIKRIIGLPNEKIEIRDNKVYVNDRLLEEPFEKIIDVNDNMVNFPAVTIPENEYFLLGDNRPRSMDSRYWKPPTIKKEDILGKVVQIIPAKEK